MDADIFVSGKKKLRIKKYPDTCGRGHSAVVNSLLLLSLSVKRVAQFRYALSNALASVVEQINLAYELYVQ